MNKQILESESDSLIMEEIPPVKTANHHVTGNIGEMQKERKEKRKPPVSDELVESVRKGSEWKPSTVHSKKQKRLIAEVVSIDDLLIFEMSPDNTVLKTAWLSLPPRLKEVFEEIIYSLPLNNISRRDDDGCYTFSYTDDEFDISVISIVIEGKAALFYKNAEPAEV